VCYNNVKRKLEGATRNALLSKTVYNVVVEEKI